MLLIVGAMAGGKAAPATADAAAHVWSDYRLGQFVASRGLAPADILSLDNNGEILLACRDGCSVASLEGAGVPALASQLELLRSWALLGGDGTAYRAAIPILDGESAVQLAELADGLAAKLAESLSSDVAELIAALEADDQGGHAWTVLFAYVLDGAVWEFLSELGQVGPRNVSHGGAPWGGEVWAYLAGDEPSTSTLRRSSVDVKMSWVEALRPQAMALLRGSIGIDGLFDALEAGETESPEIRAHFQELGILGPERQLAVPLIVESRDNAIFRICERLAEQVASLMSKINRAALVNDFGFESESQATVVTYHEVMWSLLDRLVVDGVLTLPAAIADPATAGSADLGKLVVIVRRAQAASPGNAAEGSKRDEE